MEESTKKRVHQFEILAAVVLLLVSIASFFPKPGITGYVSIESKKQKIDLTIANSQSYVLTTSSQEPFYLTSFKLSGEVIGEGIAKVYLTAKDQKILVYSNILKTDQGLDTITGMDKITGNVVGTEQETGEDSLIIEHLENIQTEPITLAKDQTISQGTFDDVCIDSCFIEMLLNKDIAYQLLLYVEEGTVLNINEISYTIRKD